MSRRGRTLRLLYLIPKLFLLRDPHLTALDKDRRIPISQVRSADPEANARCVAMQLWA